MTIPVTIGLLLLAALLLTLTIYFARKPDENKPLPNSTDYKGALDERIGDGYLCLMTLTNYMGEICFTKDQFYKEVRPSPSPDTFLILMDNQDNIHYITEHDGWRNYFSLKNYTKEELDNERL